MVFCWFRLPCVTFVQFPLSRRSHCVREVASDVGALRKLCVLFHMCCAIQLSGSLTLGRVFEVRFPGVQKRLYGLRSSLSLKMWMRKVMACP